MRKVFVLLASLVFGTLAQAAETPRRILMGVSQVEQLGGPDKLEAKNNLWEVAPSYHVFRMHGYEVDFVSPRGGPVPFSLDVDEVDPPAMVSYTIKYEQFREKAGATLAPEAVDPRRYVGYFVAGGLGPLLDVAQDARILALATAIYGNGGALGGCGHGPASLANVKRPDGEYAVKGVRVTGFPNSSEKNSRWSAGGTLLPFTVEDILRARGARFLTKADVADKFDVIVDGRIVTTMFMSSCANAAREMLGVVKH